MDRDVGFWVFLLSVPEWMDRDVGFWVFLLSVPEWMDRDVEFRVFLLSVPEWMDRDVEFRVFLLLVPEWTDRDVEFWVFLFSARSLDGLKCRVLSVFALSPRVDGSRCRDPSFPTLCRCPRFAWTEVSSFECSYSPSQSGWAKMSSSGCFHS